MKSIKSFIRPTPLTNAERLKALRDRADKAEEVADYYEEADKQRKRITDAETRIKKVKPKDNSGLFILLGIAIIAFILLRACG